MNHLEKLHQTAVNEFQQAFGNTPTCVASAPGRVNLIGEHTDYNDGFVLPMAIDRSTILAARPRNDSTIRIRDAFYDGEASIDLSQPVTTGEPKWSNYIRGVIAGMQQTDIPVKAFDAIIASDVPGGAGLSSSAALEVATATLLEGLAQLKLNPVDKALLCQKAEHDFAGMPCGIMDQFISAMGQRGNALLIDCRSHETRQVALDDPDVAILIIDSRVKHALVDGEYAQRRASCEQAAQALGIKALRDATMADLDARSTNLDTTTYQRARHVITENDRTVRAADAADQHDWNKFGQLMLKSHDSMRDDFTITTPEIDRLVELAVEIGADDVYGSRMTGGGFGGSTVTLIKAQNASTIADQILDAYQQTFNIEARWFITTPSPGGQLLNA
ncbi:galactokinase [Mucisphaera calidilacus]|uniref:Galactokinase n=1 Tax=Mucisphaera calidilacus TaxID=2527982 RepID=A0A518BZ41_9BACT|nr:galactokinase [Mucisphaera calidilacus]QDU72236.1 Galactokinase [Mucisphaera calidilacus]